MSAIIPSPLRSNRVILMHEEPPLNRLSVLHFLVCLRISSFVHFWLTPHSHIRPFLGEILAAALREHEGGYWVSELLRSPTCSRRTIYSFRRIAEARKHEESNLTSSEPVVC